MSEVTVIDASQNGMTDETFEQFTRKMKNDFFESLTSLRLIDLSHNKLTDRSAGNILEWINQFGAEGREFKINLSDTPLRNSNIFRVNGTISTDQIKAHCIFTTRQYLISMRSKGTPQKPNPYAVYDSLGSDWLRIHIAFYDGPTYKLLKQHRENMRKKAWSEFTSEFGDNGDVGNMLIGELESLTLND